MLTQTRSSFAPIWLVTAAFAALSCSGAGQSNGTDLVGEEGDEATSSAPLLYKATFHQSPVRGEPDDLLLLAGSGFSHTDRVVYKRITDTTQSLTHPSSVPTSSTSSLGVASVVAIPNAADPLDSLTVKLPTTLTSGDSYAIWVVTSASQWSAGIKINDARPLWISPEIVYTSAARPGLARQLKVVGRNLKRRSGFTTKVRLASSAATFTLNAADDGNASTTIESYVAKVTLPSSMPAGVYTVSVQRDGTSWVRLSGQTLSVLANPAPKPTFSVRDQGCRADDGLDDTNCVQAALAAAAANPGGGTVVFDPGTWDLLDPSGLPDTVSGFVLEEGVNLTGSTGPVPSVVRANQTWHQAPDGSFYPRAVFAAQGHNEITNLRFEDTRTYLPTDWTTGYFSIGRPTAPKPVVDDVLFANNTFDGPFIAISDIGYAMKHVYIVGNVFGAYRDAIYLGGARNLVDVKFRVDDSIVDGNTFKPGYYIDVCGHQGPIPSEIGASSHLDYSGNTIDGHATDFIRTAPPGFRAGSFFHMSNNHETTLVSQNTYACTGDKNGDGEAISYDSNANTFGFALPKTVAASSASSVTVSTADGVGLLGTQNSVAVPVDTYYSEHWVRISNGKGLGQARKISSYAIDPAAQTVKFNVAPSWDVLPDATSNLVVDREFWQVYTVDNNIDNTGCTFANANGIKNQGIIGLAASAADSTIEGNIQRAAGGILTAPVYSADALPFFGHGQTLQSFVDIARNTISGEVDYASQCSTGGIGLYYGAGTAISSPPPSPVVLAYGLTLSRNKIDHADALRGGAISFAETWFEPAGSRMYVNTLIHHNTFSNLDTPVNTTTSTSQCPTDGPMGTISCTDVPARGVGVNIRMPLIHSTVLYKNTTTNVPTLVLDQGTDTVLNP